MSKIFAVMVATFPEYYEYKKGRLEHGQEMVSCFKEQSDKGNLLCCKPFSPHDIAGA